MSIDYEGGMIVGTYGSEIEDAYEVRDDHGLDSASPYFDAPIDECIIGKFIENGVKEEELEEWLTMVKETMQGMKEVLQVENVRLFGTQDIY